MPYGAPLTTWDGLIVSKIPLSIGATPIEPPEIRLTQIGRQIRDLWYHYVRVPYETFFR